MAHLFVLTDGSLHFPWAGGADFRVRFLENRLVRTAKLKLSAALMFSLACLWGCSSLTARHTPAKSLQGLRFQEPPVFKIDGPLKYRKLMSLQVPPYPKWAQMEGAEGAVSLRFCVDPSGRVQEKMEVEKSSGYEALDALAQESFKKMVFVPAAEMDGIECGVATIRYALRRQ